MRKETEEFDAELSGLLCEGYVLPQSGFREAAQVVIDRVCEVAVRCFNPRSVSVRPFGSFVQDTCILGSDVDICIFFVDGLGPQTRSEVRDCLWNLGRELRRSPATNSLELIEEIFEATVPILRVRSLADFQIEADISFGVRQETPCDAVVRSLLEAHPMAKQCVLLIKYWAQRESLNKAFHGFPSAFSWVLLSIFYLQRVGAISYAGQPLVPKSQQSLFGLLVGFFAFCLSSELHDRWKGLSVDQGDFIKLDEPAEAIFIEVPGEPLRNAARCLRLDRWALILQKAEAAHAYLTNSLAAGSLQEFILGQQDCNMVATDPYGGDMYDEEDESYGESWVDGCREDGYASQEVEDDTIGYECQNTELEPERFLNGEILHRGKGSSAYIEIEAEGHSASRGPSRHGIAKQELQIRPPPPSLPHGNLDLHLPGETITSSHHDVGHDEDTTVDAASVFVNPCRATANVFPALDTKQKTSAQTSFDVKTMASQTCSSSPTTVRHDSAMPAAKIPRLEASVSSIAQSRANEMTILEANVPSIAQSRTKGKIANVVSTNAVVIPSVIGEVDRLRKIVLMKARLTADAEIKVKKLADHEEQLTRSLETIEHTIGTTKQQIAVAHTRKKDLVV